MSIKIRLAEANDFESVFPLILELVEPHLDREEIINNKDKYRETFISNLEKGNIFLLAVCEDEVCGFLEGFLPMAIWSTENRKVYYLESLVIGNKHQKKGIGTSLLDFFEAEIKKKSARMTQLCSSLFREGAHKFYAKNGYTKNGFRFFKQL